VREVGAWSGEDRWKVGCRGEMLTNLLGDVGGREAVVDGGAVSGVESASGGEFGLVEELLRVLPDLRRVSSKGEPETDEVGLKRQTAGGQCKPGEEAMREGEGKTNEEQNSSAEIHEMLDRRLIERILGRVGMRVAAALAHPRLAARGVFRGEADGRVGTSGAAELELQVKRKRRSQLWMRWRRWRDGNSPSRTLGKTASASTSQ
jgi:hypothetical protein